MADDILVVNGKQTSNTGVLTLTAADVGAVATSQLGANSGVATLGTDGKIPTTQLPSLVITETFTVASQAAMLALTAQRGDIAIRTDQNNRAYILTADAPATLANWVNIDQGLAAALQALSALTPAANQLGYFDSATTAALTALTAFGRSVIGAADAPTALATLGAVGTTDDRLVQRGRRNLLINGDLRINQPVFAGGAMAANAYGYDMWRTFGATASFALSTDRKTITLNGTIGTIMEAPDLSGATITVSVRNPSGNITVNIRPDATTAGVSGTINAGAGVQSVTLVVPTSITGNVFLQLTTSAAVTFDGPANRGGIQLELGSFASAFERVPLCDALAECMRYYEKSYPIEVAAGTITNAGSFAVYASGLTSGNYLAGSYVPFKVVKVASPTLTTYSTVTGVSGKTRDVNNNSDVNSGVSNVGTTGFFNGAGASAAQNGYNFQWQWVSDSRL